MWPGEEPATRRDGGLREDADAAGSHQQANDDEYDAPQHLAAEEGDDSGYHEYHGENPQQRYHAGPIPVTRPPKHADRTCCQTLAATRRSVSAYSSLGCMAEAIRRCGSASAGRFCRSRVRPRTYWA
jgi:hypothetical protein